MREVLIYIEGTHAVDVALNFQKGACYRRIISHGKSLAQVEVVLDDLVCVTVLNGVDVNKVIKNLVRIGFRDVTCEVSLYETKGCFSNFVELLGKYNI